MLGIKESISDLCNKIGSSYDIKESIGDLISAIGKAIETGEVRVTITVDTDYLQVEVEHQSWRISAAPHEDWAPSARPSDADGQVQPHPASA